GQANYAAAKSAVLGLTKTIAKEWGPFGVRANTVAFGLIRTRCARAPVVVVVVSESRIPRLTAPKESGEVLEIDGKRVALGIPGAPKVATQDTAAYSLIPLRREGT